MPDNSLKINIKAQLCLVCNDVLQAKMYHRMKQNEKVVSIKKC